MDLGLDIAAKYDFIFNFIQKMAGSYHLDFNNSVFLSERRSCDRNSALAHFMLENKCLPAGIEIKKIIDLYCQVIFPLSCSWHQTTKPQNFFHDFFSVWAVEKENKLFIDEKNVFDQ